MLCCVNDCGREARYKEAALCQKHYFRIRRNGSIELRQARPRYEDDRGYQFLYLPDHPLISRGRYYVAEHRVVLYEAIGPGPMCCALCDKALTWKTVDVDHIDENPRNNARSNLRPLCTRCNTWRSMPAPVEWNRTHVIEFDGLRLTPAEWARDPRVSVAGRTIVLRKIAGMSDEQALFSPKVTHNGKQPPPRKRPYAPYVKYEARGLSMTLSEWQRQPGVSVTNAAMKKRLKKGWDVDSAIFSPPANTNAKSTKGQP